MPNPKTDLAEVDFKTCTKCSTPLPRNRFVGDKTRPDGKYPRCKGCSSNYYQANREKVIQQARSYRKRPGIAQRIQQLSREYASRRFFHIRARNLATRAIGESATTVELAKLWKKQRGICPMTGIRLNKSNVQLDHIVPLVKGGSSTVANLRWVYRDVNYAKRDLSDAEFIELCRRVTATHDG